MMEMMQMANSKVKDKRKTSVFDVAYYILQSIGDDVTTMKLQKLCYYAQAWYMVWNDGNHLFEEDFQAWDNGPVCRELFNVHKGLFSISSELLEKNVGRKIDLQSHSFTEEETNAIDSIIDFYGKHSGAWLSELSHIEDPWKKTRFNIKVKKGTRCKEVITKGLMLSYYKSL